MATSQLSYRVSGERWIFVTSDPKNVKHEVRTDTAGYFQLVGLTAGDYSFTFNKWVLHAAWTS